MSNEREYDRASIRERVRQLAKQFAAAPSPADIPQELIDELHGLRKKLTDVILADRPSIEWIEFANRLKARQGTKMIDFKALHEQLDAMDKKLMSNK